MDRAIESGDYALAEGVRWLWEHWRRERAGTGRASETWHGRRVTILWKGDDSRLSALVAGPSYVERQWLSRLGPTLEAYATRAAWGDDASPVGRAVARRAASDSGLPWTLVVTSFDAHAELEELAGRRRLLLAGLALLAVLVGAGVYFIARAFTREMAVAQLQSDFVAAVSHDFRTPLTSLRQLSEAFSEARPLGTHGDGSTTRCSSGPPPFEYSGGGLARLRPHGGRGQGVPDGEHQGRRPGLLGGG